MALQIIIKEVLIIKRRMALQIIRKEVLTIKRRMALQIIIKKVVIIKRRMPLLIIIKKALIKPLNKIVKRKTHQNQNKLRLVKREKEIPSNGPGTQGK